MSGYLCHTCQVCVEGNLEAYQHHLKRADHLPPFVCGQNGCVHEYTNRKTLYEHIRVHHPEPFDPPPPPSEVSDNDGGCVDVSNAQNSGAEDSFQEEAQQLVADPEPLLVSSVDLISSAERAVLRLRSVTYMTGAAIQAFEEQAFALLQDSATSLKERVQEYIAKPIKTARDAEDLLRSFTLFNPFKTLKTKPQQMEIFQKKYGLLPVQEIPLGYGFDSRLRPGQANLDTQQVPLSFQFVSVSDIVRDVLNNTYLRNLILSETASTDGYLRSFRDASLYAKVPADLKEAIRIILYVDDLEIVQALSPAAGAYKIAGIYFSIQNLPPEINSLLSYIYVTCLAFADDAKKQKVWDVLLKDFTALERDGLEIIVDGEPKIFKVFVLAQIGDSLAAIETLGFRHPSANRLCRLCYVIRQDMWRNGLLIGEPRTPEKHAEDVQNAMKGEAHRKASGVDGPSLLHGLRVFETIGHSIFDCFHDFLQGICKMEVKLALRYYICEKKYFSIAELKSRVKFFDYGYPDKKNKPQTNFTEAYLNNIKSYNLHQTGAQMWCLTRSFPFLFADLVPVGDKLMQLISLLNQIMTIVFAHAVTENDLRDLESLIEEHHTLFMETFPGPGQSDNPGQLQHDEEEEAELQQDQGFEDFFDEEEVMVEVSVAEEGDTAAPATQAAKRRKSSHPKVIRMINKHHHLLHYVEQIRKFGPMILYNCMRYEARHFFFKLVATVSNNYKNVLKTLMEMLQMKLAADKHCPKSRLIMGIRGTKVSEVLFSSHSEPLLAFGLHPTTNVYEVQHVSFCGVDYRPKLFVTVALKQVSSHPTFARIEAVYVSECQDFVYLLTNEWKTERFDAKFCAYEVTPTDATIRIKQPADLPMFRLMSIWKRYDSDKMYLAPRTIA